MALSGDKGKKMVTKRYRVLRGGYYDGKKLHKIGSIVEITHAVGAEISSNYELVPGQAKNGEPTKGKGKQRPKGAQALSEVKNQPSVGASE